MKNFPIIYSVHFYDRKADLNRMKYGIYLRLCTTKSDIEQFSTLYWTKQKIDFPTTRTRVNGLQKISIPKLIRK